MRPLALAVTLAACGVLGTTPTPTPPISPPRPALTLLGATTAQDTLLYRLRWGAGFGASGYRVSVYPVPFSPTAPAPAGFGFLPSMPATVSNPEITVKVTAPAAWDSVRFRAVVWSTRGSTVSRDSSFVEWSLVRLGRPGPIDVDSSAVVVGFVVRTVPDSTGFALCPVVTFKDGRQGLPSMYAGGPCRDVQARLPDTLNRKQLAKLDSIRFNVGLDASPHGAVSLTQ